ncbi:ADP-ribosylation factor family-domain-containing protein [Mycena polygramma]|nr:ADP-ribosylation factor family-domain-containing protein [Mycena polygramma]
MSSIRRFVDQFYSPASGKIKGYTIPLLGLDNAGKTTLLLRLKIGTLVELFPTIGFHLVIADVCFDKSCPNLIKMPSWDFGGYAKRLPPAFLANATQTVDSDALIWVVDSSDRERIPESVGEFLRAVRMLSYPNMNNRQIPILILAAKQDVPNAMSTNEVESMFPSGPSVFVVGTTLDQSLTDGALPPAFRWLIESAENCRAGKHPAPSPTDNLRSSTALEIKVDSWLERAEKGPSAARFLHQFETLKLPEWDHYTLIRVVYSMLSGYGRQKGREMILQGIQKYAARSQQDPFNITMTYFWIQIVHFGICCMPPPPELGSDFGSVSYLESMLDSETMFDSKSVISEPGSDWSVVGDEDRDSGAGSVQDTEEIDNANEEEEDETDGEPDVGFIRFLLASPFVADEDLWTEYYSKELMMGPKATTSMVLSDRKRLPSLVGRDVIPSLSRRA